MTDHKHKQAKAVASNEQAKKLELPPKIDDTPENIAKAMFGVKPKKDNEWKYLAQHSQQDQANMSP